MKKYTFPHIKVQPNYSQTSLIFLVVTKGGAEWEADFITPNVKIHLSAMHYG